MVSTRASGADALRQMPQPILEQTAGEESDLIMRIYLASALTSREFLRTRRAEIESVLGHEVTSRWLDSSQLTIDSPEHGAALAAQDLTDLMRADLIILDWLNPQGSKGGAFVEFGYALARGKRVWAICPPARANVFMFLRQVRRFNTWAAALDALAALPRQNVFDFDARPA